MIYLQSITRAAVPPPPNAFPFNVPALASLETMEFPQPVAFLVGENGSGKSTLLEALAAGAGSVSIGGADDIQRADDLEPARRLADSLRFRWTRRTRNGFFLRAEDFFNFAPRIRSLVKELKDQGDDYERQLEDRPFADGLRKAIGSARGQAAGLVARYGEDLNAVSHGESFLKLFGSRVVPNGLYFLDEPEAPLSPLRQLAFLSLLKQKVEEGCQFIIATHSPILMAYPDALILHCGRDGIRPIAYEDTEHFRITRDFLLHRDTVLDILMKG